MTVAMVDTDYFCCLRNCPPLAKNELKAAHEIKHYTQKKTHTAAENLYIQRNWGREFIVAGPPPMMMRKATAKRAISLKEGKAAAATL